MIQLILLNRIGTFSYNQRNKILIMGPKACVDEHGIKEGKELYSASERHIDI
jgi:hypothetical protein